MGDEATADEYKQKAIRLMQRNSSTGLLDPPI